MPILFLIEPGWVRTTAFSLNAIDEMNMQKQRYLGSIHYKAHGTILRVCKGGNDGFLLSNFKGEVHFIAVFYDKAHKTFECSE